MYYYVCYLKESLNNLDITTMLKDIFSYKLKEIGTLLREGEFLLRFENRLLSNDSEYNYELIAYLPDKEKVLQLGLYNNLLFGVRVSNYLKQEVSISSECDDPYQWILINKEHLFLVDEKDNESEGINLFKSDKREISLDKSLKLLPDKSYIEKFNDNINQKPYYVNPSTLWNKCIK